MGQRTRTWKIQMIFNSNSLVVDTKSDTGCTNFNMTFQLFLSEYSLEIVLGFEESSFEISGILSMMQVFNPHKDSSYLQMETFYGQFFYFRGNDTATSLHGKRFMYFLSLHHSAGTSVCKESTAADRKFVRWREDSNTLFRSTMSN